MKKIEFHNKNKMLASFNIENYHFFKNYILIRDYFLNNNESGWFYIDITGYNNDKKLKLFKLIKKFSETNTFLYQTKILNSKLYIYVFEF